MPVARRVWSEVRPYSRSIAAILVLDLAAIPLALLAPIPLKIAVDSILNHGPLPHYVESVFPSWITSDETRLLCLVAALEILIVALAGLQETMSYVSHLRVGERMTLAFRARLFAHAQRLSVLLHDSRGTADSVYRVQYDAPSLQYLTTDGILPFLTSVVTLAITLAVIASIDWQLALVALAVTPFMFGYAHVYNRRMRVRYKETHRLESSAMQVVHEALGALRVVKAFSREDLEERRFVERSSESVDARVRLGTAEGLFGILVNTTTAAGTAAVLFLGVRGVQSGRLTLGELLMVVTYLTQLYAPLRTISRKAASLQNQLAGAERAFEMLDEVPDVPERADAEALQRAVGRIEFRDASFSYDADTVVLDGISVVIEPGTRVGIAGRTGAGKTTFVSLLPRYFDVTSGSISLDGVDVRDYRLVDLRQQFAVVPQDPVLFSTTIAENIAYAQPGAAQSAIETAAKAANAHDFISALPDGYDTVVGERGMRLSGGERQRVALARAFLKDAPILILDEPTSAVDVHTESTIVEAMDRLMEGRTTFMIAHRLSTLEVCDIVLEIEGSHLRRDERHAKQVVVPPTQAPHNVTRSLLEPTPGAHT